MHFLEKLRVLEATNRPAGTHVKLVSERGEKNEDMVCQQHSENTPKHYYYSHVTNTQIYAT